MIDSLLSYVAPHLCCGCGEIGTLLCVNCKYDIKNSSVPVCVSCGTATSSNGICQRCDVPYVRAWCVGERSGVLQRLIGDFKFQNVYAAHRPLADLLIETIGELPRNAIIVPVPTVASHIRERGYDHTLLLTKRIARHYGIKMKPLIERVTTTKQRDATRAQRIAQAKVAFKVPQKIVGTVPYVLVDDVVTTGATVKYAAMALREAGANEVWVAVIARQPLD